MEEEILPDGGCFAGVGVAAGACLVAVVVVVDGDGVCFVVVVAVAVGDDVCFVVVPVAAGVGVGDDAGGVAGDDDATVEGDGCVHRFLLLVAFQNRGRNADADVTEMDTAE